MSDESRARANYFVHSHAICESAAIGENTRIRAFVHILPGARVGRDCNIHDHVFIENDVVIGDRVTVQSGVQLLDGVRVADDVVIGPNATLSSGGHPPIRENEEGVPPTHLGRDASIGSGANVLPGVRVGARAMVADGAIVTHDVPPRAIVSGNPARIVGYVDTAKRPLPARTLSPDSQTPVTPTGVDGVTLHRMVIVEDLRGPLSAGEFGVHVPFMPRRYFMVFDVPNKDVRGEHAHRKCHQFLVCAKGSVAIVIDDGRTSEEVLLDAPDLGLYVPPMVWAVQYKYSSDALLLVFASDHYDPADYIRDYDEFRKLVS
jgi:acetyltransferase-like isoleucine patch superfamily enzyme/dTDP-4-dehydrorhamnose 3,5-epimerase-like enzyme